MRKLFAAVALLCLGFAAEAQTIAGSIELSWTLPTTGCTPAVTPCDNRPLTGNAALTAVNVYISTSPIPDNPAGAPTIALGANATTATHTMQVTNGQTLYARVRALNSFGAGPLSAQVTKLISVPVVPGVPTNVVITLTIAP